MAGLAWFASVSSPELEALAARAQTVTWTTDETVFEEGDPGADCFVLHTGEVRVLRRMADGRRIVLTTMGPGSGFGELAMLDGEPRSATIQATEPSVALRLPADAVKAVLERDPSAALAVAIGLAKRLRAADDRALGHALSTVSGRVAATLLSQAGLRREQGAGDTEVEIAGSPSDIARAVGASRAETARILHWLENDEVLTIRRGRILVHDPAALSRYLQ